ncbi:Sterol 3-beta-glucosyltransferase [Entomortierella chlamydospora]|nr:Sterol 3-beta-glucosyltransferase [Entomortierella chlamydospora]
MSVNEKNVKPPTGGSALLQFVTAALRQENMLGSQMSAFGSEDDDDIVHVEKEGGKDNLRERMLIRQESTHGLGIHSDNDDSSDEDDLEHHSQQPALHIPERAHSATVRGDTSRSTHSAPLGSGRDRKTVAEKLQTAFGYSEPEELIGEYSCWLARSVLLPGYMYLTSNHICFYANIHGNQDVTQMEGFFSKKSRTTKQFSRYWFILKNDVLSSYANQTDVYYPIKTIDLKNALSAEPSPNGEFSFNIFTSTRKYTFKTDSELTRADWVKAIQKSIFHAKMEGDNVKISIPLSIVQDVELNTMAFAEALQVKVTENEESFTDEEYYFAYFNDTNRALDDLRVQIKDYRERHPHIANPDHRIFDSTSPNSNTPRRSRAASTATPTTRTGRRPSISIMHAPQDLIQGAADLVRKGTGMLQLDSKDGRLTTPRDRSRSRSPAPSQQNSDTEEGEKEKSKNSIFRASAGWIKDYKSYMSGMEEGAPLCEIDQATFRKEFSLPDTEVLSAVFSGYLLRVIPLYGRVYLSDNYLCFKSKFYGRRTQSIVPLADVAEVNKHKGTRFYHHGVGILTKTDEEIFIEFSSVETRNLVLEALRERTSEKAQENRLKQKIQAAIETTSVETHITDSMILGEEPVHIEPMSWGTHPTLKTSRPMHITCLTIGSRGDVQPYIALCKRLMRDGHKCRISTHAEYKDWIEGHGIEFGLVGGDPAELIELCVENGMFTVSFIREGLKRFRGWLDYLLETTWASCQDTDVLIESPSAMAGIHIAEKLDIPYFRAFPFPWTRTRAFPHPFAVPEHNLGRGYNYMTYVMIEQVFWKGISGQVNRWRKETLGLGPTSLEKMDAHHVPSLYCWSPNVVPSPMDWPSWIHVTGYWFLDNPDLAWTPPDDLVKFLTADPNNKPVYIGFGSMVVSDPDGMTRTIIEAVVKSGVRAIISKGWSDRLVSPDDPSGTKKAPSEEIAIPSSIFMLKSVPHDWLFPQLAGCVHHGGAGTVAAGLRAGIPTVIRPFFGDQYFWAGRVEEAGVGVWCHDLTVKKLTQALITITKDEKMIRKAHAMGEKIRSEDGVGNAIQYFYHDLALAKQRLNRNRKDKSEDTPVKFKVHEGEDDWCVVQPSPGASGTASVGESSESTAGLNVLSGSEEDIASTSTEGDRQTLHHSTSYPGSKLEPISTDLHPSATEPGPDRSTEILVDHDDSAEEVAAKLEAMQPPTSKSHMPFLPVFGLGESSYDKEKDKGTSKSAKRTSTARKMIDSITTKATHVTGYFSPSQHGSGQTTPSSISLESEAVDKPKELTDVLRDPSKTPPTSINRLR